jgi:hypothetical protein
VFSVLILFSFFLFSPLKSVRPNPFKCNTYEPPHKC